MPGGTTGRTRWTASWARPRCWCPREKAAGCACTVAPSARCAAGSTRSPTACASNCTGVPRIGSVRTRSPTRPRTMPWPQAMCSSLSTWPQAACTTSSCVTAESRTDSLGRPARRSPTSGDDRRSCWRWPQRSPEANGMRRPSRSSRNCLPAAPSSTRRARTPRSKVPAPSWAAALSTPGSASSGSRRRPPRCVSTLGWCWATRPCPPTTRTGSAHCTTRGRQARRGRATRRAIGALPMRRPGAPCSTPAPRWRACGCATCVPAPRANRAQMQAVPASRA